jgi:hypothetical protein
MNNPEDAVKKEADRKRLAKQWHDTYGKKPNHIDPKEVDELWKKLSEPGHNTE